MYELIYKNIKVLCKIKHIKMNELETQIGLSCGYLSRMGKKRITVDRIDKAAEILGVTVDDLLHKNLEDELELPIAKQEFVEGYLLLKRFVSKEEIIKIMSEVD